MIKIYILICYYLNDNIIELKEIYKNIICTNYIYNKIDFHIR